MMDGWRRTKNVLAIAGAAYAAMNSVHLVKMTHETIHQGWHCTREQHVTQPIPQRLFYAPAHLLFVHGSKPLQAAIPPSRGYCGRQND